MWSPSLSCRKRSQKSETTRSVIKLPFRHCCSSSGTSETKVNNSNLETGGPEDDLGVHEFDDLPPEGR